MPRGLDMSIVFKLTSLDDLENFSRALKEAATLQAKIQLEDEIKNLNREKTKLRVDIEALKMEKHGLTTSSELEKSDAGKEMDEEENRPRTTLRDESTTLIEEITEEPAEEENVETPELPPDPEG